MCLLVKFGGYWPCGVYSSVALFIETIILAAGYWSRIVLNHGTVFRLLLLRFHVFFFLFSSSSSCCFNHEQARGEEFLCRRLLGNQLEPDVPTILYQVGRISGVVPFISEKVDTVVIVVRNNKRRSLTLECLYVWFGLYWRSSCCQHPHTFPLKWRRRVLDDFLPLFAGVLRPSIAVVLPVISTPCLCFRHTYFIPFWRRLRIQFECKLWYICMLLVSFHLHGTVLSRD